MLFRCHEDAYPPPSPRQLFISRKHLAKVAARKRSVESTCQKAEPHFRTLINLLFAVSKAAQNAPFICFGAEFSSLFRRSGGIDCARIFACSQDWRRRCPVLTGDSRGHYRQSLKARVCAKGLIMFEGSFQTYQALCVCVCMCVCIWRLMVCRQTGTRSEV